MVSIRTPFRTPPPFMHSITVSKPHEYCVNVTHMNIAWMAHHLPWSHWFRTDKQVMWISHDFLIIFKWWAFLYINNTLAWWAIDVKMKILHYISFLKQWAYCVICTWFAYHNPSKNDEQITQISCEFWRQNGCYREYMSLLPTWSSELRR